MIPGLKLLHELTQRKGQHNVARIDVVAYDGDTGFDAYNGFLVDGAPDYRAHVGSRNSIYNFSMYIDV